MLDLEKVRAAYFNPPPDDPERVPTRQELYACYERRLVKACLLSGGDPREAGLGEHGSLIGGAGKPLRVSSVRPERAVPLRPLPLTWFDNPRARSSVPPSGGNAEAHAFLGVLAADHLAGMAERPTGARLAEIFRAPKLTRREWSQLWHVFACIRILDLKRLLSQAGLSVYEIARAIHLSETRRADVVSWINQFGGKLGAPEVGPEDARKLRDTPP